MTRVTLTNHHSEVYALYNRNKRIAVTLALFVCCEVTVSAINCIINIPKMHFSPACLTVLSLRPVIQFGYVLLLGSLFIS